MKGNRKRISQGSRTAGLRSNVGLAGRLIHQVGSVQEPGAVLLSVTGIVMAAGIGVTAGEDVTRGCLTWVGVSVAGMA